MVSKVSNTFPNQVYYNKDRAAKQSLGWAGSSEGLSALPRDGAELPRRGWHGHRQG